MPEASFPAPSPSPSSEAPPSLRSPSAPGSPDAPGKGTEELWREVREGLRRSPPILPPKLFYDARGARLFEKIMRLEAYYPTRTEIGILRGHVDRMAERAGPDVLLLEPGSGSGEKTRLLLQALESPVAYVPVDVASVQLATFAQEVRREHPSLEVLPVVADYTRPFPVPRPRRQPRRTVAFFPGSTVGNLEPPAARAFLAHLAEETGPRGGLLIGVDLVKDAAMLEAAYNDPEGVTAEFNRNMLRHLNRILGADFDPKAFDHHAPWLEAEGRIEMRLVSRLDQRVTFRPGLEDEPPFHLDLPRGRFLVTEHSNKYTLQGFRRLTEAAGWRTVETWTDADEWFAVQFLERDP
jgi:dimethylhistidine N-methyltransferase